MTVEGRERKIPYQKKKKGKKREAEERKEQTEGNRDRSFRFSKSQREIPVLKMMIEIRKRSTRESRRITRAYPYVYWIGLESAYPPRSEHNRGQ